VPLDARRLVEQKDTESVPKCDALSLGGRDEFVFEHTADYRLQLSMCQAPSNPFPTIP
jgi:hypothetical protein